VVTDHELAELLTKTSQNVLSPQEREIQTFNFTYGNLALTNNHQPSRKAFLNITLNRGWTKEQFDEWAADKEWRRE